MSEANGTVVAEPTLGDLYRAWLAATDEWADAAEKAKAAYTASEAAKAKARELEQRLGEAAVVGVPRNDSRSRSGYVAIGGRLYYLRETSNGCCDHEGEPKYDYTLEPQQVRKLAE